MTLISLRSILILFSHLCLGLLRGPFLLGLPVKILKSPLTYSMLIKSPAHFHFLYLTLNSLGERCKLLSSSLRGIFYSPFSSVLGPNTLNIVVFKFLMS